MELCKGTLAIAIEDREPGEAGAEASQRLWSYGNVTRNLREWSTIHGISRVSDRRSDVPLILYKGQIERMRMPGGWFSLMQGASSRDTGSLVQYGSFDANEATITIHYSGLPITQSAARSFAAVLERAPHHLTPAEIRSLRPVLRERANPEAFKMLSAATIDLNGKRVLVIQGKYTETEQYIYEVFVSDATGGAESVQELYLQAPENDFYRSLSQAKQAFQSIKWRGSDGPDQAPR